MDHKHDQSRYFIHLAYKGTHFHGWQRQPSQISVQEKIEHALQVYTKEKIEIVGCGRTDTGVHASEYYAHFDTILTIDRKLVFGINALIGDDIVIYNIIKVASDAHARFSAIERRYHYTLSLKRTPFYRDTMSYIPGVQAEQLDQLNEVAASISALDSFKSFCKTGSEVHHYRCEVRKCSWSLVEEDKLVMEIRADRFLRGMVRLIVGNSVRVVQGKLKLQELSKIIKEGALIPYALSAPPQGLFLTGVRYPKQLQQNLDARI